MILSVKKKKIPLFYKKSQITIFMIIGIVILLSLVLLFNALFDYNKNYERVRRIDNQAMTFRPYVEQCARITFEDGMNIVGISNTYLLENFIKNNLENCVKEFGDISGFDLTEANIDAKINLTEDNNTMIYLIDYPITISREPYQQKLDNIYGTYDLLSTFNINNNILSNGEIRNDISFISTNNLARFILDEEMIAINNDGTPIEYISITIKDSNEYSGNILGNLAYELQPSGATFQPGATLILNYDPSNFPDNIDEDSLTIAYYNYSSELWEPVISFDNKDSNTIMGIVNHFSLYAITYRTIQTGFNNKYWSTIVKSSRNYGEGPYRCGTTVSSNYVDGWDAPERICYDDNRRPIYRAGYTEHYISTIPDINKELNNIRKVIVKASFRTRQTGQATVGIMIDGQVYERTISITESPQYVDLTNLKESWTQQELQRSNLIMHSYQHTFQPNNLRLIVEETNDRVNIEGQNIIVILPRYCEIEGYNITLEDNSGVVFTIESESNKFIIDTTDLSCDEKYTLIGRVIYPTQKNEILSREISCDLEIIGSNIFENDELRDCSPLSNVDFSNRCRNNEWLGCSYLSGLYDDSNIETQEINSLSDLTYTASDSTAQSTRIILDSFSFLSNNFPGLSSGTFDSTNYGLVHLPGDYNGDGKADLAVFHWPSGEWSIYTVTGEKINEFFYGGSYTIPVIGDFDNDGKSDVGIYSPETGNWFILNSENLDLNVVEWGWIKTIPVPADYNGDGKTDIAVYHPDEGNWHIRYNNGEREIIQWGWSAAIPVPADYTGDGKANIAVYHDQSEMWHIRLDDGTNMNISFGGGSAIPVPADYNGDGKANIAIYCPRNCGPGNEDGTWFIRNEDQSYETIDWGWSATVPVPADYTNDGKADLAVYASHGNQAGKWYIRSFDGTEIVSELNLGWAEKFELPPPPYLPIIELNPRTHCPGTLWKAVNHDGNALVVLLSSSYLNDYRSRKFSRFVISRDPSGEDVLPHGEGAIVPPYYSRPAIRFSRLGGAYGPGPIYMVLIYKDGTRQPWRITHPARYSC